MTEGNVGTVVNEDFFYSLFLLLTVSFWQHLQFVWVQVKY